LVTIRGSRTAAIARNIAHRSGSQCTMCLRVPGLYADQLIAVCRWKRETPGHRGLDFSDRFSVRLLPTLRSR
jgi:hypothetical protein